MSERTFRCLDDPPLQCLPMIRMQFSTPLRHSAKHALVPKENESYHGVPTWQAS